MSGLIKAYKIAAQDAIEQANLIPLLERKLLRLEIADYSALNQVLEASKRANIKVLERKIESPPFALLCQSALSEEENQRIFSITGVKLI